MKPARWLLLSAPLALALGCGGSSANPSSANSALADAAPSFTALSMDMVDGDSADPATSAATAATPSSPTVVPPLPDFCHPHLFLRSHEVVSRVNRHIFKVLGRIESVIAHHPTLATGNQVVWQWTGPDGVTLRFTLTRTADTLFTWLLEVEPAGGTTFATVFSGQLDRTGATGPHQGTGTFKLDLTALHAAIPSERATGVVQASFVTLPAKREMVVDAASVTWEIEPLEVHPMMAFADGDTSTIVGALQQPRSGHYVYFREPGKGGSLKIEDQMVFLCPSNPSLKLANATLVNRWYVATDGSLRGRSDAQMTGGQLPDVTPTPIAKVEAVTCHQSATETRMPGESYWLWKSEDASGSTIQSQSFGSSVGSDACDPLLNQSGQPTDHVIVPLVSGSSQDFDFTQIQFATNVDLTDPANQPYPFPGM